LKTLLSQDDLLDAARIDDLSSRVEKALKEKFEESSFQGVTRITQAMRLIGIDDIFLRMWLDLPQRTSMN
jgi:hypothetical protein